MKQSSPFFHRIFYKGEPHATKAENLGHPTENKVLWLHWQLCSPHRESILYLFGHTCSCNRKQSLDHWDKLPLWPSSKEMLRVSALTDFSPGLCGLCVPKTGSVTDFSQVRLDFSVGSRQSGRVKILFFLIIIFLTNNIKASVIHIRQKMPSEAQLCSQHCYAETVTLWIAGPKAMHSAAGQINT